MISKNIDKKFFNIGFAKIYESKYNVIYERFIMSENYYQCIELEYRRSRNHLIYSYEKDTNAEGFNNCVGLTAYEIKLCFKKIKQMGWKLKYKKEVYK